MILGAIHMSPYYHENTSYLCRKATHDYSESILMKLEIWVLTCPICRLLTLLITSVYELRYWRTLKHRLYIDSNIHILADGCFFCSNIIVKVARPSVTATVHLRFWQVADAMVKKICQKRLEIHLQADRLRKHKTVIG